MTLYEEVTSFLHDYFLNKGIGNESYHVAHGYLDNIFVTIKENPDEGYTVDGLIKSGLVSYVDAYAGDEALTDALAEIVKKYQGA
jgi:hypothetical protein